MVVNREGTRAMERAGKALMRATEAPPHFPDIAVPGSMHAAVDRALASEAEGVLETLAETAVIKEVKLLAAPSAPDAPGAWADTSGGLNVVVVDADGESAPLGDYPAAVRHHTDTATQIFPAADWPTRVRRSCPSNIAPRSMFDASEGLVKDGRADQRKDFYQMGSVSKQVVVDERRINPCDTRHQLLASTVAWAKRVLADGELFGDHVCDPKTVTTTENADFGGHRSGVRMIDGPRGPLMHRYTAGADSIITDCQIMTPATQDKPRLIRMLIEQLCNGEETVGIEKSIWTADLYLSYSSTSTGVMTFMMQEHVGALVGSVTADNRGSVDTPTETERAR